MQSILYEEAIRNQDKMPNKDNEKQDGHKLIISNRQKKGNIKKINQEMEVYGPHIFYHEDCTNIRQR